MSKDDSPSNSSFARTTILENREAVIIHPVWFLFFVLGILWVSSETILSAPDFVFGWCMGGFLTVIFLASFKWFRKDMGFQVISTEEE
jgi:hypothetical protein